MNAEHIEAHLRDLFLGETPPRHSPEEWDRVVDLLRDGSEWMKLANGGSAEHTTRLILLNTAIRIQRIANSETLKK